MILYLFAIRDAKSDNYGNVVTALSAGQAVRSFGDEVNKPDNNNPYYMHPDDYELFALGSFDTASGKVSALDSPASVAHGSNLVVKK